MIISPSISKFGKFLGRAPVAIITFFELIDSPELRSFMELSPDKEAVSLNKVILFFLTKYSIPCVNCFDTSLLLLIALAKSNETLSNEIPHLSESLIWLTSSAFFSKDLEGIQPQFKHTPPSPA